MLTRTRSAARRGFTLLELIVVIAILGILAAIAFVGYQTVLNNTSNTTRKAEQKQVDNLFRATSAASNPQVAPQALDPATAFGSDAASFTFTDEGAASTEDYTVAVSGRTVGCYLPGTSTGAPGTWTDVACA